MRHKLEPILLLICLMQAGCMSLNSFTLGSNRFSENSNVENTLVRQSNLDAPAVPHVTLDGRFVTSSEFFREARQLEIANALVGSKVSISNEVGHQFHGTLFQKGQSSIVLMNCIGKETVAGPNAQAQCKTTHVPFQSFQISNVHHFGAHDPPTPEIAAQGIRYDSRDVNVDALIFMSGRRLRWNEQPDPSESDRDTSSAEKICDEVAETARGSQVYIIDESDQGFNGILLSASREQVDLMNCIWRESIPAPNGQMQYKTNHIPFQSFKSSAIRLFRIVAPPPPELAVSELGEVHDELCIDEFAYLSDRQ